MISDSAIVRILIDKDIFTWEEYFKKLVEVTEEEVRLYEKWLSEKLNIKIDLL